MNVQRPTKAIQEAPSAKGPARRYERGAAMRERILSQTVDLYRRDVQMPRSLRGLSRELGLEAAHVLYYFGSFENLLQCVLHRWDELAAVAEVPTQDELAVLDRYVAAVRRNMQAPGIIRLYFDLATQALETSHPAHAFFQERFAYMQTELGAAIRTAQASGLVDRTLDPGHVARSLIALADGLQFQALLGAPLDAANDLEHAIEALRQPR